MKACKECTMPGHTAFLCPFKPRKALQTKKRMNPIGKVGKKLLDQRAEYFKQHPGDEYYCCYCLMIGVQQPLTQKEAQIEHFYTKNNFPELRFERSNLVISCAYHNKDKGNMDGPEYLMKLDAEREKE